MVERFTKQGVIDWLTSKGAAAVMDTQTVSQLLGRSQQTIRRFAKTGRLKCNMAVYNRAVYFLEDVAEFLLANPSLCVFNSETLELTKERIELIRRIGFHAWRPLLDACGADDVFSEVQMRFMQTKKTDSSKIGAVIERLFSTVYRKYRRKIDTKSLEEIPNIEPYETNVNIDIEASRAENDIDDDEVNIRAEARRLINEIPISYVKSFIKHCKSL
ncbi:MAG: helix-turn-helix domain-containing protein [Victivallales bacterium]|nr:helix-turn-helix domain-containing protein [Victivallales bacterium]